MTNIVKYGDWLIANLDNNDLTQLAYDNWQTAEAQLADLRELWRKLKVVSEVSRFYKDGRECICHELSETMVRTVDRALLERGDE